MGTFRLSNKVLRMAVFQRNFLRMGSALRIATREKITVAFENKEATYGTGVFACQDIARGDTIWAFDDKMCTRFTENSIKMVKDEDLAQLLYKGFMTPSNDKMELNLQTTGHHQT